LLLVYRHIGVAGTAGDRVKEVRQFAHGRGCGMVSACVLAAGLMSVGVEPPARDAVPVYEVKTRTIRIPVLDDQKVPVKWIELYVSADAGRTWELHARIESANGQLVFEAPRSGE